MGYHSAFSRVVFGLGQNSSAAQSRNPVGPHVGEPIFPVQRHWGRSWQLCCGFRSRTSVNTSACASARSSGVEFCICSRTSADCPQSPVEKRARTHKPQHHFDCFIFAKLPLISVPSATDCFGRPTRRRGGLAHPVVGSRRLMRKPY